MWQLAAKDWGTREKQQQGLNRNMEINVNGWRGGTRLAYYWGHMMFSNLFKVALAYIRL